MATLSQAILLLCISSTLGELCMKGFLKSKLVFSLIAVVLLAGAIIGPLAGNFIRAHAQAQPTVTLNPTSGPPGTLVIATGTGWVAGSPINVAFDSASLAPFTP